MSDRNAFLPRVSRSARFIGVVLLLGIQACGGDSTTQPSTGSFTLSATPVIVIQGGTGESTISVARIGGFTGSVALSVSSASAGVTATVSPTVATGATATIVVTTVDTIAVGTSSLTITGTAVGRTNQIATTTLAVMPNTAGAGNVRVDFSTCTGADQPMWFAFRDGEGAWTQLVGTGSAYRFSVASSKAAYAFVTQRVGKGVNVAFATQTEMTAATLWPCGAPLGAPKTVSGTFAGLAAGDVAYAGLGGPNPDVDGGPLPSPNFVLSFVPEGNQDLIAYRSTPLGASARDRVIIRRDQNIPNNGVIPKIDFDASESFEPATATLTLTGPGAASFSYFMAYYAGSACSHYYLYDPPSGGVGSPMRGIPAARQRPTDFHSITAYTVSGNNGSRSVTETFHTLTDRVVQLPAELPQPTVASPAGGHKRVQLSLTLPPEYQSLQMFIFGVSGQSEPLSFVSASAAWIGGSTATIALPDFSGVTGWRSSFLQAPGSTVGWLLAAEGGSNLTDGGACTENARSVYTYTGGRT